MIQTHSLHFHAICATLDRHVKPCREKKENEKTMSDNLNPGDCKNKTCNHYETYLQILRVKLVPALGCTEPIAIAYAAVARKARDWARQDARNG